MSVFVWWFRRAPCVGLLHKGRYIQRIVFLSNHDGDIRQFVMLCLRMDGIPIELSGEMPEAGAHISVEGEAVTMDDQVLHRRNAHGDDVACFFIEHQCHIVFPAGRGDLDRVFADVGIVIPGGQPDDGHALLIDPAKESGVRPVMARVV